MKKIREGYKISSKGLIPKEWKVVNFKQCINISNGQVDPKEEPYCNMKHIGPGNIEKFTGKLLYVNTAKEDMQTSGKYLFNNKDVLYGKINPQLGKVAYPQYEGICSADMYPMRADEEYIKPLFLKYLLLSNDFFKYSVSVSMRTGMPKVNREELNLYDLLLPTIEEQEKIASILSTVDEQIDNVDELIEKNKELKKGLMQKLLTKGIGHTKFKKTEIGEIPDDWEVICLSQISDKIGDGLHGTPKYDDNGEYFFINGNNLVDGKVKVTDDTRRISKEEYIKNNKELNNNTLLISLNGTIGNIAYYNNEKIMLSKSSGYITLKSIYNKNYIYQLLKSSRIINYFNRELTGTTIKNLSLNTLRNTPIPIPSQEEQEKIALILSELDEKIEEYENKKEKLGELKNGLMQQLLTGKIRV